jgi:stage II sporulation protein D
MLKKFLILPIILFYAAAAFAIDAKQSIKVGILLDISSFTISSNDVFYVASPAKKIKLTKGNANLYFENGKIRLGKHMLDLPVVIKPTNGILFVAKKAYRGNILVLPAGNKINVINELAVEDYIKGILPKEMSPSWEHEALKAQAVISRTYALKNLGRHKDFDMCNTTHCQVYGGASVEAESCNKAIKETQGEVLTFDGKYAQTVFHANCGGHTENPKYVWQLQDVPKYLQGRACSYCKESPNHKWTGTVSESTIVSKLAAAGFKGVKNIKSIKLKGKTTGKAYETVIIKHSGGTLKLNSYKFRLAVDAWNIKSTQIDSVKKDGKNFVFKGSGWGHAIGLCQWGARGQAKKGKNYKTILKFYYPGTKLEKVNYVN